MYKSVQISLQHEPKVKRQATNKKIQPLFKKTFPLNTESLIEFTQTANISIENYDNSNNYRSLNKSGMDLNSLTSEELDHQIRLLKSEKLTVFKDLCNYTEKFTSESSIKSRLESIQNVSSTLLITTENAENDLKREKDLLFMLEQRVGKTPTSSSWTQHQTKLHYFPFKYTCALIDNYPCILHWETENSLISLDVFTQFLPNKLSLTLPLTDTVQNHINFLTFTYSLSVKTCKKPFRPLKILAKPHYPNETLLLFTVSFAPTLAIKTKIENTPISLEIEDESLSSDCKDISKLRQFISSNLIIQYIENSPSLLYFPNSSNLIRIDSLPLLRTEYSSDRFPSHSSLIFTSNYILKYTEYSLSLYTNTILEQYRLTLNSTTYQEEIHPKAFKFLRVFSVFDMKHTMTLQRSLELRQCIEILINGCS